MAQGKVLEASKLLPRTFREVYAQPKIREQITAIGEAPVKAMIEFQLARLASLMVTGGNLNDDMTDFISSQLIELHPTESIADLKLCFERGAMGRYGSIQRMDGITIGEWVEKYLDEKYAELETLIEKRKTNDVAKEPVDGLEDFYARMRDESAKRAAVLEFNKAEYRKKYGAVDMETIERLRQAELEGKHNATSAPFTKADFEAAQKAFGKEPEKVEQQENP